LTQVGVPLQEKNRFELDALASENTGELARRLWMLERRWEPRSSGAPTAGFDVNNCT